MFRPLRPVPAAALGAGLLAAALTGCGPAAPGAAPAATTTSRATTAAASTTTSTTTAGPETNGLEDLEPEQALARVKQNFAAARTVHVTGSVTSGGQRMGITSDVVAGTGARVTITQGAQVTTVLQLGRTVYLTGNAAFFKATVGAQAAKALRGKFMRTTTADSSYTEAKDLLTAAGLAGMLPSGPTAAGRAESSGGRAVLVFADGTDGRFVVTNTGTALPLALSGTDGGDSLDLTFSYAPIVLSAPPKSKVVKIPAS